MKIAIIGNSHVACLKKAWTRMEGGSRDVEVDFYASTADSITDSYISKGVIYPKTELLRKSLMITSGGAESIRIDAYDEIVIYGVAANMHKLMRVQKAFDEGKPFSAGFKDSAIVYSNPSSNRFLRLRTEYSGKKWYLYPRPNTSIIDAAAPARDLELNEEEYRDLNARITGSFDAMGFRYAPQPMETLLSVRFTKPQYNVGAVGLSENLPEQGYRDLVQDRNGNHMNEEYGRIALQDIFSRVVQ